MTEFLPPPSKEARVETGSETESQKLHEKCDTYDSFSRLVDTDEESIVEWAKNISSSLEPGMLGIYLAFSIAGAGKMPYIVRLLKEKITQIAT